MTTSPTSFGGIQCPKCMGIFSVTEDTIFPGNKVKCPKCKAVFPLSDDLIKEIGKLKKDPLYRS